MRDQDQCQYLKCLKIDRFDGVFIKQNKVNK